MIIHLFKTSHQNLLSKRFVFADTPETTAEAPEVPLKDKIKTEKVSGLGQAETREAIDINVTNDIKGILKKVGKKPEDVRNVQINVYPASSDPKKRSVGINIFFKDNTALKYSTMVNINNDQRAVRDALSSMDSIDNEILKRKIEKNSQTLRTYEDALNQQTALLYEIQNANNV